jgi:hypothetical protein
MRTCLRKLFQENKTLEKRANGLLTWLAWFSLTMDTETAGAAMCTFKTPPTWNQLYFDFEAQLKRVEKYIYDFWPHVDTFKGMFTPLFIPRGEHPLLFRRMEGRIDALRPLGPTSTLGNKVQPWEPISPLGAKVKY